MGFEFAAFGPVVGRVVVRDVAEEEAGIGAMDDDTEVEVDADGPEALVFGAVEFVELEAGLGGVDLEVESCGLGGFLLVAGEAGERGGEGVGDAEFHGGSGSCELL